jgi:hypothetical protein
MDQCVGAAARLPESDRKDLAVQALARSATVSGLSTRHGVSRKFVYQQADKARRALDGAFISASPDGEVLFEIQVTKRWCVVSCVDGPSDARGKMSSLTGGSTAIMCPAC